MSLAPTAYAFTGHMVDADDRATERFPPRMVEPARIAIEKKLDELGACERDFALCQGSCGGDLLFAHAALRRGMRLTLVLPMAVPQFIARSVAAAGDAWVRMFEDARRHPNTTVSILAGAPGMARGDPVAFELANLRMLECAAAQGRGRVTLLAFWDGQQSGQRGGTDQAVEMATARSWPIAVIDTQQLLQATCLDSLRP